MAERLGDLLIRKGLLDQAKLEKALEEQTRSGLFLGEVLVKLGYVREEDVLGVLAEQFRTRFVSLEKVRINPVVLKMVPKGLAWEYKFMPIEMLSSVLLIAVSNPLDMWPMSMLKEKLDLVEVQIVLATKSDIRRHIEKHYGPEFGATA